MRVADMTEAQVVNAILDQSDAIVAYNELVDEQIAHLRTEMVGDGIDEREINTMLRVLRQTMDECLARLQKESKRIFIETYTFAEMRALLEFREEHPQLVAKGLIAGKLTAEVMMTVFAEMRDKVESRLEMQDRNKY